MMRRIAVVLVCLLVGLGIYGGSYWWFFHSEQGWKLGHYPPGWRDPFAASAKAEGFVEAIFAPAAWFDRTLLGEIRVRHAIRRSLLGEWRCEADGDYFRFEGGRVCSFQVAGFEGGGRLEVEGTIAYVPFEHEGGEWELRIWYPFHGYPWAPSGEKHAGIDYAGDVSTIPWDDLPDEDAKVFRRHPLK